MKEMAICNQNRTAEHFYKSVAVSTAGTKFGRCRFGFSAQCKDQTKNQIGKHVWSKAKRIREMADKWIEQYPRTATAILSIALPAGILLAASSLTVLTAVPIGMLLGWL